MGWVDFDRFATRVTRPGSRGIGELVLRWRGCGWNSGEDVFQSFVLIVVSILLSTVGQFVLKTGAKQLGEVGVEAAGQAWQIGWMAATNPWIVAGLGCYGLGAVTWIMVLTRVPLSWAYPILALNQVLILAVAWLFLGEQVNALRWSGVLLIIAGVFLVSRS